MSSSSPSSFLHLIFKVAALPVAMKFDFEVKTKPTLWALVVTSIVACCSGSFASIAVYLDNPATGIYCATILVVIIF
jgi:hypothetical protein